MHDHQRIPSPPFEARLSALDSRFPALFSRRILVFETSADPERINATFVHAFKLLAHRFPFLGGQVDFEEASPTGQRGWRTIRQGNGIVLKTKDFRKTQELSFSQLEKHDFALSSLKHDLFMPLPMKVDPEPYDASHFQINFIDGGVLLAFCIAHVAGDGVSQSEFLRSLGNFCARSEASSPTETENIEPLGLDRSYMVGLKSSLSGMQYHPALSLKTAPLQLPAGQTALDLNDIFTISATQLKQLKESSTDKIKISTSDAIMALIWRATAKNRVAAGILDPTGDPEVALVIPMSIRRALRLDQGSIGNLVCNRVVKQRLSDVRGPPTESLQRSAALIRREINMMHDELARGLVQLYESVPSPSELVMDAYPTMHSTSIAISSLYHSNEPLINENWGELLGGRIRRLRCSEFGYLGLKPGFHFVTPLLDGGAEIQLSYYKKGVEAMSADEVWGKYISTTPK